MSPIDYGQSHYDANTFGYNDPGAFGSTAIMRPSLGRNPDVFSSQEAAYNQQMGSLQQAALAAQGGQAPMAQAAQVNAPATANYGESGLLANQSTARLGGLAGQYAGAYQGAQQAGNLMQGMAAGTAPSAAEIQQRQGIAAAQRANLSAAAGTRGGAAMQAAAQQQAMANNANLGAQGISSAAAMRLQEQNAAQQNYAANQQALLGAAGQMQGMGSQQAQASQGSALQMALANQSAQQQAGLANQSAGLQQSQLNNQYSLGLGQQALGYGNLQLGQQEAQLGADTSAAQQYTQAQEQSNQQTANVFSGLMNSVGSAFSGMGSMFSDSSLKTGAKSQNWNIGADGTNSGSSDDGTASYTKSMASGGFTPELSAEVKPSAVESDVRAKTGIAPAEGGARPPAAVGGLSKADAMSFLRTGQMPQRAAQPQQAAPSDVNVADSYLDHLARSSSTFAYKNPADAPAPRGPGARFGGVMAQDVETVPEIGPQLVRDTPRGKMLEGGANLEAALMGLGRLHERLRALEARQGGGR